MKQVALPCIILGGLATFIAWANEKKPPVPQPLDVGKAAEASVYKAAGALTSDIVTTGTGAMRLLTQSQSYGYISFGADELSIVTEDGNAVTLNLKNGTMKRRGNVTDEEAAKQFWEMLAKHGAAHAKVDITIGK